MSRRRAQMITQLGSDASTMARGAMMNVSGALAATALSFAAGLITTHVVNVSRFGLVSIALTVILLAQVPAVIGLDVGAVRFVALGASATDEEAARGSMQAALMMTTAVSFLLAGAIFWKAPWVVDTFFHKPEAAHLLRIASLSLPALAVARVLTGSLQGLGIMGLSAWLGPIRGLVNILALVPLLAVGFGARGVAWASVATAWAVVVVGVGFVLRVHPTAFVPAPRAWRFGRLLRFSLPQTLTTVLLNAILWTDTLLLGRLRTAADVGIYTIVQRLLSPAQTISTSTGQMFAPRIAVENARGDKAVLGAMLKRVTYWNLAVSLPIFMCLLMLATALLELFGPAYAAGATALSILAAGQIVNAATGPLGQMINMSGRPYVTLVNNAVVAALNILGCLLLIPRFGVTGAAISTTGAITLVNVIKLAQVRAIFGINPFDRRSLGTATAAVLAAAVAAPIAFLSPWPDPLSQVVVAGLVLVACYFWFFWWLATTPGDRRMIERRLGRGRDLPVPAPVKGA